MAADRSSLEILVQRLQEMGMDPGTAERTAALLSEFTKVLREDIRDQHQASSMRLNNELGKELADRLESTTQELNKINYNLDKIRKDQIGIEKRLGIIENIEINTRPDVEKFLKLEKNLNHKYDRIMRRIDDIGDIGVSKVIRFDLYGSIILIEFTFTLILAVLMHF